MATTIYLVRHQKGGIDTTFAFSAEPTPEQMAPIVAEAERLHGREGWAKVHQLTLLGPGELPTFPERAPGPAGRPGHLEADANAPVVSAVGTVINP